MLKLREASEAVHSGLDGRAQEWQLRVCAGETKESSWK